MSAGASQDPQQNVNATSGLDQILMYARVAVNDPEFQSETVTQFMPKPAQNIRNYVQLTRDVQSTNGTNDAPFGQNITFKFGNEGFPNLLWGELHINMPKLVDSGASNKHPLDSGYAGTGTTLRWCPYFAERFIAGSGEPLVHRHSTEKLRSVTAEGLHIKRALCQDNEGTAKRAAYNNSVGALPDEANSNTIWFRIPIWLPHCTDDVNFHQILPVQAFATEFQMSFKVPSLLSLIQSDITTASNIVVDPAGSFSRPQIFLRLGYLVTEKAERGTFANMVLQTQGLTYQTMHVARETVIAIAPPGGNANDVAITIPIKNSANPCAFMAGGIRYVDDLQPVGTSADHTDTNVPPRSPGGVVRLPNWTNWQPWTSWGVFDGSSRVMDSRGQDDWLNSTTQGFVNYFPGDIANNFIVIPCCQFPTIENHGMGHKSFSSMVNPKVVVNVPAPVSTEGGSSSTANRQIDWFCKCARSRPGS